MEHKSEMLGFLIGTNVFNKADYQLLAEVVDVIADGFDDNGFKQWCTKMSLEYGGYKSIDSFLKEAVFSIDDFDRPLWKLLESIMGELELDYVVIDGVKYYPSEVFDYLLKKDLTNR